MPNILDENILDKNSTTYTTMTWTDDGMSTDDSQPYYDPTDPGEGEPIYPGDEALIPPDPRIPVNPPPRPEEPTNNKNLIGLGLLAWYMIS